ncbi:MAG TPA: PLP-dependent aminotransferase family protein [Bacteroidia bacterium]|jgi:GntR family transcriptional regulator/MocR family aminotransferase|nr:PLP-dependent aminotransferase family protein [Bacteroidia bacterium]
MFSPNTISINKKSPVAVYLQISNGIINKIQDGTIKPGTKMPSTRELSIMLKVHRKTVVNAYVELDAQGWIFSNSTKGTFVNTRLPEVKPQKWNIAEQNLSSLQSPGYVLKINASIKTPSITYREMKGFHDGPDVRLVPIAQLARTYKGIISRKSWLHNLSYVDVQGNEDLRNVLSEHLNSTRGLQTTAENIFISRGSQMGIYLAARILLAPGDNVIVGEINYYYADKTLTTCGANLLRVRVEDDGINVDDVEVLCKKKKIRAMYITSHHHYPTTVTLSASKRMKLLALAEQYKFIIIEDDYDYDFHYDSNPILPLASADKKGMVIYIGTLSKTVAPSLRIGYVAAPKSLIDEFSKFRQIIDVQGDPIMEKAVAELFTFGEIRRHMKKALKEYHLRRDFTCSLLKDKLGDVIDFKIPEGGLAIWTQFDKKVPLPELSAKLRAKGVILSSGLVNNPEGKKLNCTRMGFGWMNTEETEYAVKVLCDTIKKS